MSVLEQTFRLRNADVDCRQRLRWSTLFTMFQEASIAHTEQLGMGREKTLDRGLLWIVTLQEARIYRMPVYDDPIVLRSWPGAMMHLFFPRYYRLTNPQGEVLAEGSALWCLVNLETRKFVFPEEVGVTVPGEKTGLEAPLARPLRNLAPTETWNDTVRYSFVDLNGHMNNTRYFDLAQDALWKRLPDWERFSLRVEYINEARLEDTVTLGLAQTPQGWYFCGAKDQKPLFRMSVEELRP